MTDFQEHQNQETNLEQNQNKEIAKHKIRKYKRVLFAAVVIFLLTVVLLFVYQEISRPANRFTSVFWNNRIGYTAEINASADNINPVINPQQETTVEDPCTGQYYWDPLSKSWMNSECFNAN